MWFGQFFLFVLTQLLMLTNVARTAPGHQRSEISENDGINETKLHEIIEKELLANEGEPGGKSEVRAESYDAVTGSEVTIVVFPVEIKDNKLGGDFFTDHAANEMISRLDGDIIAFEKMKKLIHFLENNMNNHKNVHLADKKQIEDAQTLLEVMDNNMLIPFENNLEAIKEQIIKMDHRLQGDALGHVKQLAERAETFLKEAHEKLKVVVVNDEEWTKEEIAFNDELEHKVIEDAASKYNKAKNVKKVEDNRVAREVNDKEFSTYPENDIDLEKIELELLNRAKANLEKEIKMDLLNVTNEKLLKSDTDEAIEMIDSDGIEVEEATTEITVSSDENIDPGVKILLEKTNFWRINEQLTSHKHEQTLMIGLPVILLIPFMVIVVGLVVVCKYKKEIIAVKIVNPWGNVHHPLRDVSSICSANSIENLNHHKEK